MSGRDELFAVLATEWPEVDRGNLAYSFEFLFEDVPLVGARVLDIGAGEGLASLWAIAAGARKVVALEPEAAGSSSGMIARFTRAAERLGSDRLELRAETLQEYEPPGEPFDVVVLLASINHLNEEACRELHRDGSARETYRELLGKLARLTAPGGRVVLTDASRHNFFAGLGIKSPIQPWIEWDKHQPPRLWAELLEEVGFERPRIRWQSFNSLRRPGRFVLGNRVAAYFLQSAFSLTMTLGAG